MNNPNPNLTTPQRQLPVGMRYMPVFNDTYNLAVQAIAEFPAQGLPAPSDVWLRPPITEDGHAQVSVQYSLWPDRSDIDVWSQRFGVDPQERHHHFTPLGGGHIYLVAAGAFPNGTPFEVTFVMPMSVAQVDEYMASDYGPEETWTAETAALHKRAVAEAEQYEPYR